MGGGGSEDFKGINNFQKGTDGESVLANRVKGGRRL